MNAKDTSRPTQHSEVDPVDRIPTSLSDVGALRWSEALLTADSWMYNWIGLCFLGTRRHLWSGYTSVQDGSLDFEKTNSLLQLRSTSAARCFSTSTQSKIFSRAEVCTSLLFSDASSILRIRYLETRTPRPPDRDPHRCLPVRPVHLKM